ncbi:hypothetical protein ACHAWF_007248 [Thalassiosira exigua]
MKTLGGNKTRHSSKLIVGLILLVLTSWNVNLVAYQLMREQDQTAALGEDYAVAPIVSIVQSGPKTITWKNWPAIAHENVGAALVLKGESFFDRARELYFQKQRTGTLMDEFLEVYKNRPDPINMCGIRINHAMALFLAVKQIKPTLVIESGVNAGVSTYFIRSASSSTKIFAIDPAEKPLCNQKERWIDSSDLTINYTGKKFIDLMDFNWRIMIAIKEVDPESTLIFIDDHLHVFQRLAGLMKYGFRHFLIEDNYKNGEGATATDKISTPKQMFGSDKWKVEGNWLFNNLVTYSEFPPLVPSIMAKAFTGERKKAGGFMVATDLNNDIVHPILRPDLDENDKKLYTDIATELGYDPTLKDNMSYMQFMNYNQFAYLELLKMPPSLLYQ